MKIWITRDQAVWERSTFEVEVPDGLKDDALKEALRTAVDNYNGYGEESHQQEILDEAVNFIDTETKATLADGTEIEL